jgi:hypothetical protein
LSPTGPWRPAVVARLPRTLGRMNTPPPHIPLRNQWRIPREIALHVACRDLACVYCGNAFLPIGPTGARRASWEHIINDVALVSEENIAVCCVGCNASKGTKSLSVWLQSAYCAKHGINESTLAPVARAALIRQFEVAATSPSESPSLATLPVGCQPFPSTPTPGNAA